MPARRDQSGNHFTFFLLLFHRNCNKLLNYVNKINILTNLCTSTGGRDFAGIPSALRHAAPTIGRYQKGGHTQASPCIPLTPDNHDNRQVSTNTQGHATAARRYM